MKHRYIKNVATLKLDRAKCVGCSRCVEVCPHSVFRIEEKTAAVEDLDSCMECGACARNCPAKALEVKKGVG
ncbi:MAG: 4Fe-4S ferredoxin iron-sulfur binding domain protein [Firmicutes bacterium]|nr:4Fe-4S ferredoxin iron-sulfur binding domain protein [Bacillota bacterium]